MENDGKDRFKPCEAEADWLKEGRREGDWTKVMTSVLGMTAGESGSHMKNRKAAKHPGKQADEGLKIFLTELIHKLHINFKLLSDFNLRSR